MGRALDDRRTVQRDPYRPALARTHHDRDVRGQLVEQSIPLIFEVRSGCALRAGRDDIGVEPGHVLEDGVDLSDPDLEAVAHLVGDRVQGRIDALELLDDLLSSCDHHGPGG